MIYLTGTDARMIIPLLRAWGPTFPEGCWV